MTTTTPHPYLDPHENPAAALFRLLQLLPTNMQETTAFDRNEAKLAEAISYHAAQVHQITTAGMAALRPLLPPAPNHANPVHASLCRLVTHITNEAEVTRQIADLYQGMANDFHEDNAGMDGDGMTAGFVAGKVRRAAAEKARALMTDYGRHYYYPLGRLMQLLPGDITNAPRLTPEQGRMCQAVSHFAGQAAFVIWSGLKAINDLQFIASKAAPLEPRPDTSAFVAYLEAESAFMHANKNDYRDAARNVATAT
jgi:hypothetical protein